MNLGTAQQVAQDSPKTQLNVAGVGPQVAGGKVSGNLLGRVTSVIQSDNVSAMAVLHPHNGSGEGLTEEQWTSSALLPQRKPYLWPLLSQLSVSL